MLKIILNRLKPQAEIITEEQAGFRARKSTTEQIFNLRILHEKYLKHQQDLYHVFVDFKKAFNRVWHAALWATMKKYNISTNLIRVVKNLYDKATSAVLFNSSIGDWFRSSQAVICAELNDSYTILCHALKKKSERFDNFERFTMSIT